MQVQRVVDVQAGQDREDIGLQKGDQNLKAGEDDDEGKGHDAEHAKQCYKSGNYLEKGVTC